MSLSLPNNYFASQQFSWDALDYNNCLSEQVIFYHKEPIWQKKPMSHWTPKEVQEFLTTNIGKQCALNSKQFDRFECISGYIFENLSEDYCQLLSNSKPIGSLIFREKTIQTRKYTDNSYSDKMISQFEMDSCDLDLSYFNLNECSKLLLDDEKLQIDDECLESLINNSDFVDNFATQKPARQKISRSTGKRSEKLWQFLINLLTNEQTCPELIKWENFDEGTFKFVKSNKVAELWGSRKQNKKMTYEKFSRAMRYYYKSKVLLPVPGKRLVYKFGPQAKGWNSQKPIY